MAHTLKKTIEFRGVGLHWGEPGAVRLLPCDRPGIYFHTKNGEYPITAAKIEEDNRLTGFKLPDGTRVRTAEHLLGSIMGMGLEGIIIETEGEEVPILDGSAHIFAQKITEAGIIQKGEPARPRFISTPVVVGESADGKFLAAVPAEELRVTYVIDYPGTMIGTQRTSHIITEHTFLDIISRARTFGLTSELDFLKKHGLAKGGSLDNALMFDKNTLLNEEGLRFPLEPVTHKVIDLLGDLALLGFVPKAHYIAICAGHGLHRKLSDKLRRLLKIS